MTASTLANETAVAETIDTKAVLRGLTHAMTIRITQKRMAKLLYAKRGKDLEICYENDNGSQHRDPWIPPAVYRQFDALGGSREAFIAWLETHGAKPLKKLKPLRR